MKYYIGIDGGGTKTEFCLADEQGKTVKRIKVAGTSYKHAGWQGVMTQISEGVKELLEGLDYQKEGVYICFGAPNYGESKKNDVRLRQEIDHALEGYRVCVVNDSYVGFAGSLGLQPGINIVAGTGSIAFGENESGVQGRVGGWSDFFGDEGSCHWLGIKVMECFSKQADGRLPQGPLYEIVMKHFGVDEAIEVIDKFETDYQPYRDKIAGLQLLMQEAARQGDGVALHMYDGAAHELAQIIIALYEKLEFPKCCNISYSGGLFQTGELILTPLRQRLKAYNMNLVKPLHEPVVGAVMLAGALAEGKITLDGGRVCI